MNKITATLLLSSAIMLAGCDQAQEDTDSALESGADLMEQAAETTSDAVYSATEMANDAVDATSDAASAVAEGASEMASDAASSDIVEQADAMEDPATEDGYY